MCMFRAWPRTWVINQRKVSQNGSRRSRTDIATPFDLRVANVVLSLEGRGRAR